MTETPCPHCKGTGKVKKSPLLLLRERAGRTQAETAAKLEMTQPGYARLEARGASWGMRYGMWDRLQKLYGVTRQQLMGEAPLPGTKAARPPREAPAAAVAASKKKRAAIAQKNRRRK